jgi:hypothetical protein
MQMATTTCDADLFWIELNERKLVSVKKAGESSRLLLYEKDLQEKLTRQAKLNGEKEKAKLCRVNNYVSTIIYLWHKQ